MTLTVQNQITLLYDLLDEHSGEHFGNISEYQQIRRLVKSLLANQEISNDQLVQLLPEIYNYGLQGESASNAAEHISANKESIENWVNVLEQTRLE
ncbi:YtzH-like family protein [Virgibacillus halodenitrificans]|uniref:YtzH-like family protein n=1 Tax=Virgibacillus halodenitrificans TaxID=1482 RepID=A0ABR7VPN6_VIRHA|nr:YtzH-like family protein [Virgibacillus halodenitrificans]MBD1223876.1 YtzH-like family protein [Virgibacillus halodenitrificans]MCJ0931801.1 YtzH-like family protein [Virgibacillus halodenitrificans]MYL61049.1 hypothetical protein [Virgibacillus halodenitrificans]CDQ37046.1 hypothetical protein BN993_06573 [Virgibacillus halodenitrificans]